MRRLLSLALVLMLALPLAMPILALGQTSQARLLLCCRKGGAHHCMQVAASDGPVLSARCLAGSTDSTKTTVRVWEAFRSQADNKRGDVCALQVRQIEAGYGISFHRARQKRGPPASRI